MYFFLGRNLQQPSWVSHRTDSGSRRKGKASTAAAIFPPWLKTASWFRRGRGSTVTCADVWWTQSWRPATLHCCPITNGFTQTPPRTTTAANLFTFQTLSACSQRRISSVCNLVIINANSFPPWVPKPISLQPNSLGVGSDFVNLFVAPDCAALTFLPLHCLTLLQVKDKVFWNCLPVWQSLRSSNSHKVPATT